MVRSAELQGSAEGLLESAKSSRVMQNLQLVWDALSPASRGRRIVYASRVPPTRFVVCVCVGRADECTCDANGLRTSGSLGGKVCEL